MEPVVSKENTISFTSEIPAVDAPDSAGFGFLLGDGPASSSSFLSSPFSLSSFSTSSLGYSKYNAVIMIYITSTRLTTRISYGIILIRLKIVHLVLANDVTIGIGT